MTKQIIMTAPTRFGVQYSINPWMDGNVGTINTTRAAQQWSNLRNELVGAGVDVIVMPEPPADCPDAVFTANAGLLVGNEFILSRFTHAERQPEESYFFNYFAAHEFNVVGTPSLTSKFEGAGDALWDKHQRVLWQGHGFRSADVSAWISGILRMEVRPLRLVDPRWYHLDTCFCPLDDGNLLWYPAAFDEQSQQAVREAYQAANRTAIEVQTHDALAFACNSVSVGNTIVMPKTSKALAYFLEQQGYSVVQCDMSEFLKSGGACKCLTLEVLA